MAKTRNIQKLLAANRSEIAIRIFRAANELGLRTVGIYSQEDRLGLHRFKADEAYQVGVGKGPVEAYLDIAGIVALAKAKNVDAIHPGYGFLSENPAFARACEKAGITFVGPTPALLELLGDKTAARRLATSAGVAVLPGTEEPVKSASEAQRIAREIGYPIIVKAAMGGGGRGMRVVHDAAQLDAKLEEAQGEARSAFGDASVFLEKFLPRARHIEVRRFLPTITATAICCTSGSAIVQTPVQRRHQKVVEVAPAGKSAHSACSAANCAKYGGAHRAQGQTTATQAPPVEFLLRRRRRFKKWYFIEANPRIQVEHTVTEMVTGIVLVQAQSRIAQGCKLHDAPLSLPKQESLPLYGAALQCRVTTEDPEKNFAPDYGKISTYRSPAGFGNPPRRRHGVRRRAARRLLRFAARESDGVGPEPSGSLPAHGSCAARIPHSRRQDQYSVSWRMSSITRDSAPAKLPPRFSTIRRSFFASPPAATAPPSCSPIWAT